MNIMKYVPILILFCLPLIFTNCAVSESSSRGGVRVEVATEDYSQYRNLADYLRRVPGVQVTGAGNNIHVQVRGTSSFESETRPLYVVDGRIVGNSYTEVNRFLNMSEVSNIRVLVDSEAGSYGARGANGVIVITLKR